MTLREEIHAEIDEVLDKAGIDKKPFYGSLSVQLNFEAGKRVISIRERETRKETAKK